MVQTPSVASRLSRRAAVDRGRRTVCWVLGGMLIGGLPLSTAVIVVESDCTLVDAITAANTDNLSGGCPAGSGADEIQLTTDISLSEVNNQIDGPNGLPSIASEITIDGGDFTIARHLATPELRIFHVGTLGKLTLENATVSHGFLKPAGFGCDALGPGIFVDGGRATLVHSSITENELDCSAGGIYNLSGDVTLRNSTVSGNIGGGIWSSRGSLTVTASSVSDNRGSGIANISGSTRVERSTLSNNDHAGSVNTGGTTLIVDSTVIGNSGGPYRGGLSNTKGEMTLINSTVSGNPVAGVDNGGYYEVAFFYARNSTIVGNGGVGINNECFGAFGCISPEDSSFYIQGTIVANNGGSACEGFGLFIDLGGNLDDDGSCPSEGRITGVDLELRDNGGPTLTHALLPGSTAIDAAGGCGLVTDQRGFLRNTEACDSGAFEFGAFEIEPQLTLSGSCPGEVTLTLSGATPGGIIYAITAENEGLGIAPGGPCAGAALGLEDPRFLGSLIADSSGDKTIQRNAPMAVCGQLLQAMDAG